MTRKNALEHAQEWTSLEQMIIDLRTRADACRRRQTPYHSALAEFASQTITSKVPIIELGTRNDGYRIYFRYEPEPIRWKDLLIAKLSKSELQELTDQRAKRAKLIIESRMPVPVLQ